MVPKPDSTSRVLAIAAFALVVILGIVARPALPIDETRYLSVAWDLYSTGSKLIMHKNGEIYVDKPPLLFWLIDVVWSLAGISAIAARLVAPAFTIGCVILVGPLARRLWPDVPEVGARATWILAGFATFAALGSLTMFDTMVAFATMLGIWSLLEVFDQHRPGSRPLGWLGFGAAMALGVYSKGPVVLVHLLPVAIFYRLWLADDARPPVLSVAKGMAVSILVALALIAPWLVPALIVGGHDYAKAILWTQSAGRIADSFAHQRPFWFYVAVLPVLLFPWAWIPANWRALRAMPLRSDAGLRLCLVWQGAALLILSMFSGKQLHYVMPELPAAALMLARVLPAELRPASWRFASVPILLLALVALVAPLGVVDLGKLNAFLTPHSTIFIASVLAAGLVLVTSRLPFVVGHAARGLGIVLLINFVIGFTVTRDNYDASRIATSVKPYDDGGIAVFGQSYQAEFNFAGRLSHDVDELESETQLNEWLSRHPAGAVVSRLDRPHPDWRPAREILFRNKTYGIWAVADKPKMLTSHRSTKLL